MYGCGIFLFCLGGRLERRMGCLAGVLGGREESLKVTLSGRGAARVGCVTRGTGGLGWIVGMNSGLRLNLTSGTLVC